ncbi:AAA family ATPase [Streptomyces sp. NBC_01390]|uniref:ATP/GTP-binding protein n=1 Tax=Streptomyces sp. NBC_01390 TaxID=2903850 RepID=UPI00324DB946
MRIRPCPSSTAVIAQAQALGEDQPWTRASFIDEIVALQRQRELEATGPVQVFDRSPVCTHALATYLGWPVSPTLAAELERITSEGVYERQVFFVRNLGFCEPTAARRISFQESLAFERIHEDSYRAFGYELVAIPASDLASSRRHGELNDRAPAEGTHRMSRITATLSE